MQIGFYGLGKMGGNMTQRLLKGGHEVVVGDRIQEPVDRLAALGGIPSASIEDLVSKLKSPRVFWIMIPSGDPVEVMIETVAPLLAPGDIIVDGGNSNYQDTLRRGRMLRERKIHLVDVGTSGGIWGLTEGYSMMVGGDEAAVHHLIPTLETLAPAPDQGWGHVGPVGSGHFAKMVHNGIEYGIMQAYAEGFEILKAKQEFNIDVHQMAEIWRTGSVIRSWLLDLTANALREDPELTGIADWVADSGEGRWAVKEAIDLDVPAPVITLSLMMRFVSRQPSSYAAKLLAAMRQQFGGHAIRRADE